MAIFNPDQDPINPDWTSASRGYKANTAGAEALANVGDIAIAGVKVLDQENQTQIQQQVQQGVDQATGEWGTDARTGFATTDVPEEVKRFGETINNTSKAYKQGLLTDSHFQAKINALSKQVRARFPGYRDVIDATISQTLGRSTANDLRKAMMVEWESQKDAADKEETRYMTDVSMAMRSGDLQADWMIRRANGNPYSKGETYAYMSASYARKARIDQQSKEYELADKASAAGIRQGENLLTAKANYITQKVAENALSASNTSQARLFQMIEKGQAEGLSGKELAEVRTGISQLKTKVQTQLQALANSPEFINLKPESKQKIVEQSMAQINTLESALYDKNFGYINASKQVLDTRLNDALKAFGDNPLLFNYMAAEKFVGGQEVMSALLLKNPEMALGISQAVQGILTGELFNQENNEDGLIGILKNGEQKMGGKGTLDPQVIKSVHKANVRMLLDDTSDDVSKQAAILLFGKGDKNFLSSFIPADRMSLFETMVSPRITEKMKRLSQDDPQLFQDYKNWVQNAGIALFKKDVDTINDANVYGNLLDIRFDKGSNQLIVKPAGTETSQWTPEAVKWWDAWKASSGKKSVDNLNKYLKQLSPIMEEAGENPQEAIDQMFQAMGVNQEPRQGNLWQRISKALGTSAVGQMLKGNFSGDISSGELDQFDLSKEAKGVTTGDALKDTIARAEGTLEGGYNTRFGGATNVELSSFNVAEIMTMQKLWQNQTGSSAVGRYQFMRDTLKELIDAGVIKPDDEFTPKLQEKMADYLIKKAKEGTTTLDEFIDNLAGRWAGLPNSKGVSSYAGVGMNKRAGISKENFMSIFE